MRVLQLTIAAKEPSRLPFPEEKDRLRAIRRLGRFVGRELLLFCVLPEQVQLVVVDWNRALRRVQQSALRALQKVAVSPLETERAKRVDHRRHLVWLVKHITMLVTEERHFYSQTLHEQPDLGHPALYSGSCFQELVGARVVDGLRLGLPAVLTEYRLRRVYGFMGLPLKKVESLEASGIREAGAARVVSAVASAMALEPPPAGKGSGVVVARRAAVSLARMGGIASAEIRWALRLSRRSINRLAQDPCPEAVLNAARTRLALEDFVRDAATSTAAPERAAGLDLEIAPARPVWGL